jgi:probable F420-dependent oxidoreductase
MDLPLESDLRLGFITSMGSPEAVRTTAQAAERLGYDSLWVGDHVAFPLPILDPLLQLAQAAGCSRSLRLGTCVYLLPLRHPTLVAKQVATLDHLCAGRLVFGVGVGGEFPNEYAACGVPHHERGGRLSEAIPLLRRLWTGKPLVHQGRFYQLPEVRLLPAPVQPGGPPIWCGGRSEAALRRIGRMGDGWVSYVVTPERYRAGLDAIERAAREGGRRFERFGSGHLLFTWLADSHDEALEAATAHLSQRYAMDFRRAAQRYAALGRPEEVAQRIHDYREAGVRELILDFTGPLGERDAQLERFAKEVRPLLGLRAAPVADAG